MKIGMVFPAVEYGGQEKNLILLSNELHKNKYEVEVLSYGEKSFSTNKLNSNIKRINLESSGYIFFILNFIITLVSRGMLKIYLKSLIKIFGYLFNNEYKVLICFQSGGLVSILKAITRSKTKIITRESTSPIQMSKLQKSILPFSIKVKIKKFLYKAICLCIFSSAFEIFFRCFLCTGAIPTSFIFSFSKSVNPDLS